MNLFIDSCSDFLFLLIFNKNNEVINKLSVSQPRLHSELALPVLDKFLKEKNINFKNIKNIYIVNGPGSFTGTRVSLSIVKAWKIIYPEVKIHVGSSFLVQSKQVKFIQANKYEVYTQKGKVKKIDNIDEELIGYKNESNIFTNFLLNWKSFSLIKNIEELKVNYIKGVK